MEASDDQFSLKWNNFQSNLASGFADLLQEEDMVDVTLACEGKYLQAHKVILSVCSPYFKDLFKANPCKHPIVILKDCGHQELLDMLDFMYRGEASVRQEDLAAFLKLAETLKVKGLAGGDNSQSLPTATPRKAAVVAKKKVKLVETPSFEPDDDPGDPEFTPAGGGGEPKRKRKRLSSPAPKTDSISSSATNNFISITNPKQELQEPEEVEFLDESQNDPLVHYIQQKKQPQTDDEGHDGFDDSNMDAGDDTHDDLDMTAGPSNIEDSTDQVPQDDYAGWNNVVITKGEYTWGKTQKGEEKIIYRGFYYIRQKEKNSKNWRCTFVNKCKAKLEMLPRGNLFLKGKHNHQPPIQKRTGRRNLRPDECDWSNVLIQKNEYTVVKNQYGQSKIGYRGYFYKPVGSKGWRCIEKLCPARALHHDGDSLTIQELHNHPTSMEGQQWTDLHTASENDYSWARTAQGNLKIIYKDYFYVQHDPSNSRYWRCVQKSCRAKILRNDSDDSILVKGGHTHPPPHAVDKEWENKQVPKDGYTWGKTAFGNEKLIYREYFYSRHEAGSDKHWRCNQKTCRARIQKNEDGTLCVKGGHNHLNPREMVFNQIRKRRNIALKSEKESLDDEDEEQEEDEEEEMKELGTKENKEPGSSDNEEEYLDETAQSSGSMSDTSGLKSLIKINEFNPSESVARVTVADKTFTVKIRKPADPKP